MPLENSPFFSIDQASLTISFSNFSNLELKSTFGYITDIESKGNHSFLIENSLFQNITSSWKNNYLDLFFIQNSDHIYIQNSSFVFIKALNIFDIKNICGSIFFYGLILDKNQIYSHIFNIEESINITIIDLGISYCNQDFGNFGGGTLRIYNSFDKFLKNINISYCFSSKTAFGLKFIDDSLRKNFQNESFVTILILKYFNVLLDIY